VFGAYNWRSITIWEDWIKGRGEMLKVRQEGTLIGKVGERGCHFIKRIREGKR